MAKKVIATVLLSVIALLPLASCGGAPANASSKQATTVQTPGLQDETVSEEATEPRPDLPDADFGGYNFRVLNINQDAMWWAIVNVDAEEEIGEVVNDAIYKRNANMEDKYNFKLTEIPMSTSALNTSLKKSVKAGGDDYDLVCPVSGDIGGLVSEGALLDLYKIPHIDPTKPWWNKSLSNNFSIGNKLYFTMSDLLLTDDENVAIVMYNKKMAQNLNIDSAESLYTTVEEGKWTLDKMVALGKTAIRDINGDGKYNGEDSFGMIICSWAAKALVGGAGEAIALKDKDDIPYLSCKNERFINVYNKVRDVLSPRDLSAREGTDFKGRTEEMFVNDKGLFCIQVLSCVRLYKQMDSDFAVLPLPKFDESQANYVTYCLWASGVGVPATCTDPNRTGIILEALTAESYRLVRPAYYEVALAAKYLRDDKSFKMLDIVLENRLFDLCTEVYNWGGFAGQYESSLFKAESNFTSLLDKYESKISAAMQKTVDAYANAA